MPILTRRRSRGAGVVAALLGVCGLASPLPAEAGTADPLGCSDVVHDPDALLDPDQLGSDIERTADWLDADLRVRVEPSLDGGLDQRIDQLRRQCPGWDGGDGQLADDLVVMMFSPTERENAVFFGDSSGGAPEVRWDEATEAMIPGLRDGDYTGAVEAGLTELRSGASLSPSSATDDAADEGGSKAGLVLAIIALVAVVGFTMASRLGRESGGGAGLLSDSAEDAPDEASGWFSSGRSGSRGRSLGLGWASRRAFRSSTRRPSSSRRSGRSRRAGGGSKKW